MSMDFNNIGKVSVIVPIYKVEEYLDKCVTSIVNQSYLNLEIILVDDGSPDTCPQMCDFWAVKDERIRVFHKINGGLASARNVGIDVACGQYYSFIDSDDYIDSDMIEKMVHAIEENDVDIVSCGVREVLIGGKNHELVMASGLLSAKEALKHLLLWDGMVRSFAWNKLYRAEIVGETRYQEHLIYGEDTPFVYEILKKSRGYYHFCEAKYNYIRREASLIGSTYKHKKLLSMIAAQEVAADCKRNFPEFEEIADCHVAMDCYFLLSDLLKSRSDNENNIEDYKVLVNTMKRYPLFLIKKYYSTKNCIQWFISIYMPRLFIALKR